jgi:hypothetical protein
MNVLVGVDFGADRIINSADIVSISSTQSNTVKKILEFERKADKTTKLGCVGTVISRIKLFQHIEMKMSTAMSRKSKTETKTTVERRIINEVIAERGLNEGHEYFKRVFYKNASLLALLAELIGSLEFFGNDAWLKYGGWAMDKDMGRIMSQVALDAPEYAIEKIIRSKEESDGTVLYLVKWN